jgi:hypothetical protein
MTTEWERKYQDGEIPSTTENNLYAVWLSTEKFGGDYDKARSYIHTIIWLNKASANDIGRYNKPLTDLYFSLAWYIKSENNIESWEEFQRKTQKLMSKIVREFLCPDQ